MKFITTLFLGLALFTTACQSQDVNAPTTLDASSFQKKMSETPGGIVLDVRTPGEFSGGFIERAVNIDFNSSSFESEVNKLDKTKPCFVYCLSGGRSGSAADYMRSNGFKEVYELKGGIMAWNKAKLPLTNGNNAANTNSGSGGMSIEEFNKITLSAPVVLIDFYAPWCVPCKKMEPMLEELKKEYEGKVSIVRINVDEHKTVADQFGIESIPLFKLYKAGKETTGHVGAMTREEVKKMIES